VLNGYVTVFAQKEDKTLNEVIASLSVNIWPTLCEVIKKFGSYPQISEILINMTKKFLSYCYNTLVSIHLVINRMRNILLL